MLERDPHGNVQVSFIFCHVTIRIFWIVFVRSYTKLNIQVAKIETEKMLLQMVDTELTKWKQEGKYKREFSGQCHFFGYHLLCSSGS